MALELRCRIGRILECHFVGGRRCQEHIRLDAIVSFFGTDDLVAGQTLTAPEPTDSTMAQYYGVNDLQPATAITTEEINDTLNIGEGIEFWGIEFDFIVSADTGIISL